MGQSEKRWREQNERREGDSEIRGRVRRGEEWERQSEKRRDRVRRQGESRMRKKREE